MNNDNPLLFCIGIECGDQAGNPYTYNPFRLLNANPNDNLTRIEAIARKREEGLRKGHQPEPSLRVSPGEFNRAASAMSQSLQRMTFDILANCTGDL
jgi:hypothetical protein